MASIAPWRLQLQHCLEANKHIVQSKYFQLATVKQNGLPAVRTVVFRGFEEGSDKLLITTDARSKKVEEIKAWPLGQFVAYFDDTWEQFRISGHFHIIGPDSPPEQQTTRKRLWDESSPKVLVHLVGPCPDLPLSDVKVEETHFDKVEGPVENFLVVSLDPTEVDYLNLKEMKKLIFEKDGSSPWTEKAVVP